MVRAGSAQDEAAGMIGEAGVAQVGDDGVVEGLLAVHPRDLQRHASGFRRMTFNAPIRKLWGPVRARASRSQVEPGVPKE